MGKQKAIIACLEIGAALEPVYRVSVCHEDHVHVRLKGKQMPGEIDLMFVTPEDAAEFADAIMNNGYDVACGIPKTVRLR